MMCVILQPESFRRKDRISVGPYKTGISDMYDMGDIFPIYNTDLDI